MRLGKHAMDTAHMDWRIELKLRLKIFRQSLRYEGIQDSERPPCVQGEKVKSLFSVIKSESESQIINSSLTCERT